MPGAPHVIRPSGPKWFRRAIGIAGALYLAAIFLGSAGSSVPQKTLPRPLLYFTQVACLFPRASTHSIEYRVAAYSCSERRFRELDHREYFPMHPDDKENRYHRLAHFYRRDRTVMHALDDHLVERHNARALRGEPTDDGIDGPIGGILVMSLRIPLPEPGARVHRYTRTPFDDVPPEWHKRWYSTPRSRLEERCDAEAGAR
jgi:hypothetical protein